MKKLVILFLLISVGLAVLYADIRSRPNVVMIIIDTLRADKLGCYGFPENLSPELDVIAENGVKFQNVIAQSSWTRPSIGSMLTGLYPRSIGILKEKYDILPDRFLTLPEILQENGYRTFGVTANPNINKIFNFGQGFDRYIDSHVIWRWMKNETGKVEFSEKGTIAESKFHNDELVSKLLKEKILKKNKNPMMELVDFDRKIKNESQLKDRLKQIGLENIEPVLEVWKKSQKEVLPSDCQTIFRNVLDMARSQNKKKPSYVQINIMEVHNPWLMLRPEFKTNILNLKDEEFPWYHDAVKQVSFDINLFIHQLRKIPGWENTLFIITSDHGEGLNDHPDVAYSKLHGRLLYDSQVKVPMIWYHHRPQEPEFIRWLRKLFPKSLYYLEPKNIDQPVRLLDVMPTLLDYLNLDVPDKIVGKSLIKIMRSEETRADLPPYFIAEATYREADKIAAISKTWKYIENRDGHQGVNQFELQQNGRQENGKLTDKILEQKTISATMKSYLEQWEKQYPKVKGIAPGQRLSTNEINQLKTLGYIN